MVRGGKSDGQIVRRRLRSGAGRGEAQAESARAVHRSRRSSGRATAVASRSSLEPPLLTALVPEVRREKRRKVPLAQIPERVRQAVLAIEDRRFYDHPGVDPIGIAGAMLTNLRGDKHYLVGGSTHHAAARRRTCCSTPEKLAMTSARSKNSSCPSSLEQPADEGRDPRAVSERGVSRPARLVRDPRLRGGGAAVLRQGRGQPVARRSGDARRHRSRRRRRSRRSASRTGAASGATSCSGDGATRATSRTEEAVARPQRAADAGGARDRSRGAVLRRLRRAAARREIDRCPRAIRADVHTTLDLHLQRVAQDAVRGGLEKVDEPAVEAPAQDRTGAGRADRDRSAHRRDPRDGRRALLQSVAVQPRARCHAVNPDRCSSRSCFSRRSSWRSAEGRTDLTPATVVTDEPTTFFFEDKDYARRTTRRSMTGRSRCGARWRSRATSRR